MDASTIRILTSCFEDPDDRPRDAGILAGKLKGLAGDLPNKDNRGLPREDAVGPSVSEKEPVERWEEGARKATAAGSLPAPIIQKGYRGSGGLRLKADRGSDVASSRFAGLALMVALVFGMVALLLLGYYGSATGTLPPYEAENQFFLLIAGLVSFFCLTANSVAILLVSHASAQRSWPRRSP